MPNRVYMKIDGIAGSCMERNHADYCDVRGFDHEMTYPFDITQGQGKSEVKHGPIKVLKPIDKASAILYTKLSKREKIDKVLFEFWWDNPQDGQLEKYFTIEISDCRVVLAHPYTPAPSESDTENAQLSHMEWIGFAYRVVDWAFLHGGNTPGHYDFGDPTA